MLTGRPGTSTIEPRVKEASTAAGARGQAAIVTQCGEVRGWGQSDLSSPPELDEFVPLWASGTREGSTGLAGVMHT